MAEKSETEELIAILQNHLSLRTFLVGRHVTAADLAVLLPVLHKLTTISDFDKLSLPNVFRWADHLQNLPGIKQEIEKAELFASFPSSNAKPASKSEQKKLAKLKAAQEKKMAKKEGKAVEGKPEEKKEEAKKEEVKAEVKKEEPVKKQEQKPEGEKKPKQKQQQQAKP